MIKFDFNFLFLNQNIMLWVLKRDSSFEHQTDGKENIHNFTLKNCVYLNQ